MSSEQYQKPGTGALAFLYSALYDDTINSRIKESDQELAKVIDEFGLTGTDAAQAIKELVSSNNASEDLLKTIASQMNAEMNADYSALRQHIW